MKNLNTGIGMMLVPVMAVFFSVRPATAQNGNSSQAGFEKLKSLVGVWQGVKTGGDTVELTYQLMSGGSALVETLKPENEPSMVSVYHHDGDRLMMTHYCSAGNQPRMVATIAGSEPREIEFEVLDVTNMEGHNGHMKKLKVAFPEKDRLTQVWTFSAEGNEMPATFEFRRKG